jgi:hypothetical protein
MPWEQFLLGKADLIITYHSAQNVVSDRTVNSAEEKRGDEIGFNDGLETNCKNITVLEAKAIQTPVKPSDADVFAGNISSLSRSAWKGNTCQEALITVIYSLIMASELELINEEVGHKVYSKFYDDIVLSIRFRQARQA